MTWESKERGVTLLFDNISSAYCDNIQIQYYLKILHSLSVLLAALRSIGGQISLGKGQLQDVLLLFGGLGCVCLGQDSGKGLLWGIVDGRGHGTV